MFAALKKNLGMRHWSCICVSRVPICSLCLPLQENLIGQLGPPGESREFGLESIIAYSAQPRPDS